MEAQTPARISDTLLRLAGAIKRFEDMFGEDALRLFRTSVLSYDSMSGPRYAFLAYKYYYTSYYTEPFDASRDGHLHVTLDPDDTLTITVYSNKMTEPWWRGMVTEEGAWEELWTQAQIEWEKFKAR